MSSEPFILQPSTVSTRLLAVAVCALLGWSAWARGGTVVALQGPLPWIGLAILILLALDRLLPSGSLSTTHCSLSSPPPTSDLRPPTSDLRPPTSDLRPLISDLVFWSGLVFLALLSIQWWNAGRYPYFHPFEARWVFTPPPHPGWPWAVDRNDAAEMLHWFFPAWALMLALRHARRPAWLATRVAWFLIINAGCLAAFGIAQALSGTQSIFWITPMTDHFFASFGYENHAASYFALLFALAAGMLLQELNPGQRSPAPAYRPPSLLRRASIPTASICAVLCLIGLALSFSRAGLVLAMGLSAVMLFMAGRLLWRRVSIAQRVAVVAALIMGMSTLFFVVTSMGGVQLAQKASQLPHMDVSHELDMRLFMVQSASQMWRNNPWFGLGGWGYRHFLPVYALRETGRKLGLGYANVHSDALQFLCEFGMVGVGLMLAATLAFAWPLLHGIRRQFTPGLALAGVGLLAVLCHSLIDLPFRSPGILYAWLAVCGVAVHLGQTSDSRCDAVSE